MKQGIRFIAALAITCLFATVPASAQETSAWEVLAQPRTHILMRHAEAPGTGDPAAFRLGACETQRNLSDAGRNQARRIGDTIRSRDVRVDRVLSSQWCRASETAALLGLGAVVEDPALNSFFENRADAGERSDAVRRRLSELDGRGERAVLVTHQVNVTALTGVSPASGEMIVIRKSGDEVKVLARIAPERP